MNITLIYEVVPEETKIYSLDVNDDELSKLRLCHGHMINLDCPSEAQEAMNWLSSWLEGKEADYDTKRDHLAGLDLKAGPVIFTGFVL